MSRCVLPSKVCQKCGRYFDYRAKWSTSWQDVKFCSKKCSSTYSKKRHKVIKDLVLSLILSSNKHFSFTASDLNTNPLFSNKNTSDNEVLEVLRFLEIEGYLKVINSKDKFLSYSLKTKFLRI